MQQNKKPSYYDLRIFPSSKIYLSRETSEPTTLFYLWVPYKQLIKTNKKTQDAIEMTFHYMFSMSFLLYYHFESKIVLYLIPKLFVISHRPLWFMLAWGLSILDSHNDPRKAQHALSSKDASKHRIRDSYLN